MPGWLTQSDALGAVKVLFWAGVFSSLACFLADRHLHALLKTYWKPLLVCVILVLIWRIPRERGFFHGTEYEDSYVYTVAGRQMAEHIRIEPAGPILPFSITVCAVGSLTSCRLSDNYPEHLIGYPYLLSVFFNLFGYQPSIGSILNVVCACFVDVLIFLLCIVIADDVIVAGSAALIFAITPVFAVWGLETSAEPIADGCITLVLWLCLRYAFVQAKQDRRWNQFLTWCAFTTTLLFSLTVKRENILLPIALPLVAFLVRYANKHSDRFSIRRLWWVVVSAVLSLIFSLQLHLDQTMSSQVALLNTFPLTARELISYLPVFVGSFFVTQWYGGAVVLVLAGAIFTLRRRGLGLFPLLLFAAFLLLYAFHIRSYYEVRAGDTDPRAALRFSMSLMSLWSILAGFGATSLFKWLRRSSVWKSHTTVGRWTVGCAAVAVVAVSYGATTSFREDVVEDEFRMRIEPALAAAHVVAPDRAGEEYILTMEPLILQMYAGPSVDVLSLHELNATVLDNIGFIQGTTRILYLDEQIYRTSADAERYRGQLACLNQFSHNMLASNAIFSVVRIGNVPVGHE